MDPFLGELKIFAGNYSPIGWMACDGRLLSIAQYDALFSLIGTTYGGDGVQTFALPDLRGRVAIGQGTGYTLGQASGSETVTLTSTQLASHTHVGLASSHESSTSAPAGKVLSSTNGPTQVLYGAPTNVAPMAPQAVAATGGTQPHDNIMPSLVINWIIAVEGIYPSQG